MNVKDAMYTEVFLIETSFRIQHIIICTKSLKPISLSSLRHNIVFIVRCYIKFSIKESVGHHQILFHISDFV